MLLGSQTVQGAGRTFGKAVQLGASPLVVAWPLWGVAVCGPLHQQAWPGQCEGTWGQAVAGLAQRSLLCPLPPPQMSWDSTEVGL